MGETIDILVVGGGVNGAGIARDAAGRGLKTMLCEKQDLAQHTSSASTKLIHGGLRYLEHYEFRLVREALIEREVLLRAAPHIIWPLRFVLPHHKGLRPRWLLRLGLFIYDHLGGRKILPPTKTVRFSSSAHREILSDAYAMGFEYSDCWVEDSRLVALCALDARERGADIRTHAAVTALERDGAVWRVRIEQRGAEPAWVEARAVVNAAGPWVDGLLARAGRPAGEAKLRLVKGSHIIVRRVYDGDHAYILQHADGRIVFAIPYERDYTLIGTTDVPTTADALPPTISEAEIDYLCGLVSEYLRKPVTRDDIVSTYSGVRPLYDDSAAQASVVTRDYVFDMDAPDDAAPLLSVFGGKITTFRKLSEQAVDAVASHLGESAGDRWTRDAPLPGGEIPNADFAGFLAELAARYPWAPKPLLTRVGRAYGARVDAIFENAGSVEGLGRRFAETLYEAEVRYLIAQEFATCAEDVLWRRSKLGLHMTAAEIAALEAWFDARRSESRPAQAPETSSPAPQDASPSTSASTDAALAE